MMYKKFFIFFKTGFNVIIIIIFNEVQCELYYIISQCGILNLLKKKNLIHKKKYI